MDEAVTDFIAALATGHLKAPNSQAIAIAAEIFAAMGRENFLAAYRRGETQLNMFKELLAQYLGPPDVTGASSVPAPVQPSVVGSAERPE
jgi:hypothetical protein